LRFHQERSRPGRKQPFFNDSSHIGVLSPFYSGPGSTCLP
jgi:hypothetical protein